jgi:hypothetical protein
MRINKTVSYFVFSAVLALGLLSTSLAVAQPTGGGPGTPIPVTGIEMLLAAGGLWGAKKIFDRSKKK